MYVRLGFAVTAHLEPDIVLLDEVLAVGDVAFQAKCLDRISALRKSGRTIVFVSHDLASIYRLCDRALLLDHGRIVMEGAPRPVIDRYQQMAIPRADARGIDPQRLAECVEISFFSQVPGDDVRSGYPMVARLRYRVSARLTDVVFRISFYWPSGYLCAQLTNEGTEAIEEVDTGTGTVEFHCPVLPIVAGLYRVDVEIQARGIEIDSRQRCATLSVQAGKPSAGDFYIESHCNVRAEAQIPAPI